MLASELITNTRRHLEGSQRVERNKLDGALDSSTDQVVVAFDVNGIQQGAVISVGLEDMYVWSVDDGTKTATVERGYNGSVQYAHDDGDIVEVNARYTAFELLGHVNTDLVDLSAPTNGLYRVASLDLTAVSGQVGYDFAVEGFLSIADARWKQPDSVTHQWWPLGDMTVEFGMPTDVFPSGAALFINGAQPDPNQDIRIRYRASFNPLTGLSDDVAAVTGLPETALDLPALGAALLAMAGRPTQRAQTSSQGDTRRATEVSVGDVLNAPAALRQTRNNRIVAEAARLSQQWVNEVTSRISL